MMLLKCAVLLVVATLCSAITTDEINDLKSRCRADIIDKNDRNIPLGVRLAFHDCVGDQGCDGCIDFDNEDNAGLENIYSRMQRYYDNNRQITVAEKEELSFADWIVLCGVTAAEKGIENGGYTGDKTFSFKVGRQVSTTCDGDNDGRFPHPHMDHDATMTFFSDEFGLNERQATVLLGAHALGRASLDNSGWNGPWTDNPLNLNNEYYTQLEDAVAEDWIERDAGDGHYQWKKRGPGEPVMMFHADMCLLKDIQLNSDGSADCSADVSQCPDSMTASDVHDLADDNALFVEEFIDVFTIMIENVGETGNSLIKADDAKRELTESNIIRLLRLLIEEE